ncbi:polycystin-1-like protein 2 [Mytilus edulis]|uniref:polycystin-1-like protein 2 n=1 Tax=Mytilus edulis TaxID=6550 RepID=UPI0039EF6406
MTLNFTINTYASYVDIMEKGLQLVDYIKMDDFLQLYIRETGNKFEHFYLDFLRDFYNIMIRIDQVDWNRLEMIEKNYTNWLYCLVDDNRCAHFSRKADGYAELQVQRQDVVNGVGYLIYLRAYFEGSYGYFVQHAQTIDGDPPELELECRLNCMKKTATTSILSLVAVCPSCTMSELTDAKFSWDFKHFPIDTRKVADYPNWQDMMLSDTNNRWFVMKAGLAQNQGYIIEATITLPGGRLSKSMWIVTTDYLSYGGSCRVERSSHFGSCRVERSSHFADQWQVTASGWKDEGFRDRRDKRIDWKEHLNYRIDQVNSEDSSLLYYGYEAVSHIKIKPGLEVDLYTVTLEIQIYDIFKDYATCTLQIYNLRPPVADAGNIEDISAYIKDSNTDIEYYYQTGSYKLVAMNTEVAGATVTNLHVPVTAVDVDPSEWVNLGYQEQSDGTTRQYNFDELWKIYQNPPQEDSTDVIQHALSNFSNILDKVSTEMEANSITNVRQIVTSLGTVIENKDYVINSSASKAFEGNRRLIDKFINLSSTDAYPKYEDYISTSEGIIRVLSNALNGILPDLSADIPSSIDIYTLQQDLSFKQQFAKNETNGTDLVDMTTMERAYIATQIALKKQLKLEDKSQDVQNETPGIFQSLMSLGTILEMLNHRKQLPVYVKKEGISTSMDNKTIPDILKDGISQDSVDLEFTTSSVDITEERKVQITVFENNPFSWDKTESKFISSKTVSVSIGNGENMVVPSKIKFQNSLGSSNSLTVQIALPSDGDFSQEIMYKMYWRNAEDSIIVGINNAESSLQHVVYIQKDVPPSETVYDLKKTVDSGHWTSTESFSVLISGGLYDEAALIYIGIFITSDKNSTATSRKRRSALVQNTTVIEYSVLATTTGCRVWDEVAQQWEKTSCQPSLESTVNETVCLCSNPPGNNFATTFYVPPNTIDFGSVFSKFDISNSAVLFTVISIIVLFLLISIWAVRQDKRDPEKWAISYLVDNAPTDEYLYMVTVYTGLNRNAGTKSNVRFVISGEKKTTEVKYLDDGQNKGFGIGSTRRFVMTVPQQIHNPAFLQIWHDDSGKGGAASWYLNKVLIEDLQTEERYLFLCNKWLSLDHDDGKIQSIIPVVDTKETKQFSFLFNEQTRENTTDSHLWLSVGLRPEPSNFSRLQRLACCLTLLFLTMISNAMFYGQGTGSSQVSLGPLNFSLAGIYISFISLLLTIPVMLMITYLFRKSCHLRKDTAISDMERLTMSNGGHEHTLPWGCQIIAWALVVSAVVLSGFFVILYSMEWGKTKSEEWLLCFFLSFFESMFVMDPLKIIVIATVFAYISRRAKPEKNVVYNKELLLEEIKKKATSPVSYCIDTFRKESSPLNPEIVSKLKVQRKAVLKAEHIFTELILYAVFLTVLYLISFSNRDVQWYYSKQHIEQQLVVSNKDITSWDTIRFENIKSTADFHSWLSDTLVPFVFPKQSYYAHKLTAYYRQYLQDQVNFRLGPIRLRQVRAVEINCPVQFWDNDITCYDKYSLLREDDRSYCVGWESGPCVRDEAVYNITSAAWKFSSAVDIWGLPTTGQHSTYSGGGYLADFGVNNEISQQMLKDLYKYVWIDRKTRAVFTEFTLYNVNENLFVYLSFLCEFPEVGGVLLTPSIQFFRPYQHVGSYGFLVFICEIFILLSFILFIVRMIITICKERVKFLKEMWNVFDLFIVILFFIGFIMYVGRCVMINKSMAAFHKNIYKFVNFGHLATWDEMLNVVIAILIFLTTIRLMRVLNYSTRVTQLATVLSHVAKDLLGCLILFFIVYMAFVGFGHLIFGRHLVTYKTLLVSVTTITNAIIGKNSIDDLFITAPVLGHIYYFLFVLFVIWILMTMLCATLNMGIREVRRKSVALPTPYGILDLTSNLCNQVIASVLMLNPKHHSEFKENQPVGKLSGVFDQQTKVLDLKDLFIDEYNPSHSSLYDKPKKTKILLNAPQCHYIHKTQI